MSRNGSGVYTLPAGTSVSDGDVLDASKWNTVFNDLATDANTARPVVAGGTGSTTASAARTALGLAIGADVQAYDAGLASIAGLTTAADRMLYTTALDTYAVATLTAAGRALLDDADAAAQRTTLGLGGLATLDILDEDDMATNSATRPPSQQSVKAYVDTEVAAVPSPVKAWVTFNGTSVVAIKASDNVSSITDNGTGDYTVNFTSAMADADYAAVYSAGRIGVAGDEAMFATYNKTTTALSFNVYTVSGSPVDRQDVNVVVIR